MSFREREMSDRSMMESARGSIYNTEHYLAWFFALGAIVLGVIGLLRGFGLIGDTGAGTDPRMDGFIWLLPAIAAGLVSQALHKSEHHRRPTTVTSHAGEDSLFTTEHSLAYLTAAVAVVTGVLGVLVGFDVFDRGNIVQDGFTWSLVSIGAGVLTNTLHAVRHHQTVEDEDYIVAVLERRVGARGTMPAPGAPIPEQGRGPIIDR